jgi:hypothetical protein
MGDRRRGQRILVGKPKSKRPLENLDIDGNIILKWIFRKLDGDARTGLSWLRVGTGEGLL